jgi:hypothetical protein
MIVLLSVAVFCVVKLSPVVFKLSVAIQVYVEPTLLVKGILTVFPVQIVAEAALVIVGVGLTVTETTIGAPVQTPAKGVIVYVAVPATAPVVVNVSEMVDPEEDVAPVTPV